MKKFAIMNGSLVNNVVLWDGETECSAIPEQAIELPMQSPVSPGYKLVDGEFVAPPVIPFPSAIE